MIRLLMVALTVLALLAGGCSSTSESAPSRQPAELERDRSVRARLDRSTGSIRLPVDDYYLGQTEVQLIAEARNSLMGRCLREQGYEYTLDSNASIDPIVDDRTYGFWVREFVEEYGVEGPIFEPMPSIEPGPEAQAWSSCGEETPAELDFTALQFGSGYPIFLKLVPMAYRAAEADPEWQQILSDFHACLADEGLAPSEGLPFSVDTAGSDDKETIRRLLLDVDCKDQLDFIQRITDILAQYQAPLLEQHAAELAEPQQRRNEMIAYAEAILLGR